MARSMLELFACYVQTGTELLSTEKKSDFYHSILTGDTAKLKRFLSNGEAADQMFAFNGNWLSPLHLACITGQDEAARLLLTEGAEVNRRSSIGESPLYVASAYGHLELAGRLLAARADPDLPQNLGCTPMWIAAQHGHHLVVMKLIEAQADVNQARRCNGSTPLYIASQNGHAEVVKVLIEAQADVDSCKTDGCSPLYIASQNGHREVVAALVEAQAGLDAQQTSSCSPVYIAAQEGHKELVETLVWAGANVDLCHHVHRGVPPLHMAAQFGHDSIVELLINEGHADVNLPAWTGVTALHVAAQAGNQRTVKAIVRAMADLDVGSHQDGATPLHTACQMGHNLTAETLVKAQSDVSLVDSLGRTPLHMAACHGHQRIVDILIRAGAEPDGSNSWEPAPLHIAAQNGHRGVVAKLLDAQADLNRQSAGGSTTALFAASREGHWQVVEMLLKAQADASLSRYNGRGATPLHIACQMGHIRVVESLVTAGADVCVQTHDGYTSLHAASKMGHRQVMKSLLTQASASVDIDAQMVNGCSSIFLAAQNGHCGVVMDLAGHRANVDLQANNGSSPIWIASQNGHHSVIHALLKSQANVNTQQNEGYSPLHIACKFGHYSTARLLILAHADANSRALDGSSPVYAASQAGHCEVLDLLVKAQADVNAETKLGTSPLFIAAQNGHHKVVDSLIRAQARVSFAPPYEVSPFVVAAKRDHWQVMKLLMKAEPFVFNYQDKIQGLQDADVHLQSILSKFYQMDRFSDTNCFPPPVRNTAASMSLQLHSAMIQAGFHSSRAALQSSVADALQQICRRLFEDRISIVGSFSEGWGSNLVGLDGTVDSDSDIDVTLIPDRLYHIRDMCRCSGVEKADQVEYSNGFIECSGFASAVPAARSTISWCNLRPAVDYMTACRLCCYPTIAPLLPDRVSQSNILPSVLRSLEQEVRCSSSCHAVLAAAPGQLRVSTTFLEKRLLRSLGTVQGQLFILLKYLLKKVICPRVQGLKTYHVKTIMFRMLDETPVEQWKPENLVSLARHSLKMLLDCVEQSSATEQGRLMDHFFLGDAGLYLKSATRDSIREIGKSLCYVIDHLHQLLMQLKSSLCDSERFYFHPFLILPNLQEKPASKSSRLEYHEIYNTVKESLILLSHGDCSLELQECLLDKIGRLPDCARSAREALRALACLKFGSDDAAVKTLVEHRGHQVCRGISCTTELSAADATADFVCQHLLNCDSAWKFCFDFPKLPRLHFLPQFLADCFPRPIGSTATLFYMNFDALLQCLRLELIGNDGYTDNWIQDVARRSDADAQELMTSLHYCPDMELMTQLLSKFSKMTTDCTSASEMWQQLQLGFLGLHSSIWGRFIKI